MKDKDDETEKDSGVRKIALIGGVSKDHTLVFADGNPIILPRIKEFKPGQYILVDPTSGFFEKVLTDIPLPAMEMTVKEVLDSMNVRAEIQGNSMILVKSKDLLLEEGDHIAVDPKNPVILRKLPKPKTSETHDIPDVPWSSIIDQEEAVEVLKEIGEGFTHGSIAEFYGRRQPRGIMFWGPPGCGKTLLAKALATSLGSKGFFTIRGPEILSKWVGSSESHAREFFSTADVYFRKTGKKAVLFIDEADAILGKRGSEHHSIITDTLVPQFLTLMDGLKENSAFVILATNRPDQLDPAVVREGRIDKKVHVKRPGPKGAVEILKFYFGKRPLGGCSSEDLSVHVVQTLMSLELKKIGPSTILHAGHYVSGAFCEMLVEESATQAYQRNIKDGKSKKGIIIEDVEGAAKSMAHGLLSLDHSQIIREHALR